MGITTPTSPILILKQWMPLRSLLWQRSEMNRTLVMSNLPASGASLIIQFVVHWFAMLSLGIITNFCAGHVGLLVAEAMSVKSAVEVRVLSTANLLNSKSSTFHAYLSDSHTYHRCLLYIVQVFYVQL